MSTTTNVLRIIPAGLLLAFAAACGGDDPPVTPPTTPKLEITTAALPAGRVGVEYETTLAAKGGDTNSHTWSVKSGELPDGIALDGAVLSGTPGTEGTFVFTVEVSDAKGGSATKSLTLRVEPEERDPLVFTTVELPAGIVGAPYQATITADGGSGENFAWTLVSGALPAGLILAADGTPSTSISGTPAEEGSFQITLRVTDSDAQTAEQSFTLEIGPEPIALSIVTPAALLDGTLGSAYLATLMAMGGSGEGYVWSLTQGDLPAGLTLSAAGEISGTPTLAGASAFTVRVTDSAGATAELELTLTINPVGPQMRILTTTLPEGRVGVAYSEVLRGTGGTGSDFMWSIVQGSLPPGLTLNATGTPTTAISGTPTAEGDFTFTVQVQDSLGQSGELELSIHVEPAIIPIRILTSTVPEGVVNEAYEATLTAADGFGSYNWVVTGGALPGGLSLEMSGTPSVRITGTPIDSGTFTATVTVFDQNNETDSRAFTFVIAAPAIPVTIVTATLPNAGIGALYNELITAADGSGVGYTWSVAAGTLPPGLTLDPNGTPATTLSGMPSASGSYTFTIQVTDSAGGMDTQQYTINVGTALLIETPAIPRATFDVPYTATIVASGGTDAGYIWSISDGSLPAGLTLGANGTPSTTISGTPTSFGTRTFTVEVRDSGNNVARQSYTLSVLGPQRYVSWVGDTAVDNDISVFVVDITTSTVPGAPIQISPLAPGVGDAGTTAGDLQFSPDNTKIAFIGDFLTDGVEELFVVDLSGPAPLTAVRVSGPSIAAGDITNYFWSPDSRWIAYQGDQETDGVTEIYVVDTTAPTPTAVKVNGPMVTGGDVGADDFGFSADSTWLYYNADQEVDNSFYLYIVDLTAPTPGIGVRVHPDLLGSTADVGTSGTFFTPDGSRLIYVADQETVDVDELWMVPLAGRVPGAPQKLSGTMVAGGDVDDFDTFLSPDGNYVAYIADAETDVFSEVWVVDISGPVPSAPVKVSAPMQPTGDATMVSWSPDSTRLMYLADQDTEGVVEIYVVGIGGALPATPVKVNAPLPTGRLVVSSLTNGFVWSPDGTWVAYRADTAVDSAFHLFVVPMTAAGPGTAVQLSTHTGAQDIENFLFSPDGQRIAYRGDDLVLGRDDLYVVDLSSGTPSAPIVVAETLVAAGDVTDYAWFGNERLMVEGDLEVDVVSSTYLVDLDPTTPLFRLHPEPPQFGDVNLIAVPF